MATRYVAGAAPCRRSLLRTVSVFLTLMLSARAAEPALTALAPHPRLFAQEAEWKSLRARLETDPLSAQLAAIIHQRAEAMLTAAPVEYIEHGAFLHAPMRQVQGRILALAMTWRLSGEARFLERARQEMLTLAALPDWCPRHFLDTGEAALGMAVGLDWLFDALTPAERDVIAGALIDKALRASVVDEQRQTWISAQSNWNPVCHGGLVVAALAVAEREPELARRIIDRAIANVPRAGALYAPAGAYSEGPGYWAYGTSFYVLLIEALRSTLGDAHGLELVPGFLRTADSQVHLTGPSGNFFNFADCGYTSANEPVMLWFARELRRADVASRELTQLAMLVQRNTAANADKPSGDGGRLLPFALLWRDPTASPTPIAARPLTWWSEGGRQPQAAMRSAWDDPRATFVALKGGMADDSHAHMDAGGFVLEADGVRWAVELGADSYPRARQNGLAAELFKTNQTSRRWELFRVGPDSHNLLRFADRLPAVAGIATIRSGVTPTDGPAFVVDLSATWRAEATRAERGFRLLRDRRVVIQDEWATGEQPTVCVWQWLTRAQVTQDGHDLVLSQAGEQLRLRVDAPTGSTTTIEDVSQPRQAFDSPNPGFWRIVIRMPTAAHADHRLIVVVEPGSVTPAAAPAPVLLPLGEW